eukprot:8036640-Lingulodinium_polyedra.AAC.1
MAPCAVFSLLHALRIGAGAGIQRACGSRERTCTLPRVRGHFGSRPPLNQSGRDGALHASCSGGCLACWDVAEAAWAQGRPSQRPAAGLGAGRAHLGGP